MLSRYKLPSVLYRHVTSSTLQTQRHGRILESRQLCWTEQCLLPRKISSESKPDSCGNPLNKRHPRQKGFQNIHPSAYKVESCKSIQHKETPLPNQQSPDIVESSYDDAHFENLRKTDKVPANYSLIYMDSHQHFTLVLSTGAKTMISFFQVMAMRSLYEQWQAFASFGLETSSLASDPKFVLTVIGSVLPAIVFTVLQTDSRKRIFRIYEEKAQDDKYIAIKSQWIFWKRQNHFTGEEVKYISDWDKSVFGIVAGNVTIKGKRHRIVPSYFKALSLYNEFCGFRVEGFSK